MPKYRISFTQFNDRPDKQVISLHTASGLSLLNDFLILVIFIFILGFAVN